MISNLQKPAIDMLRKHGFNEILMNAFHLVEEIEKYSREGQRLGVKTAYSFEGRIEDGELIGDAPGIATPRPHHNRSRLAIPPKKRQGLHITPTMRIK
jgi:hypothetical protein